MHGTQLLILSGILAVGFACQWVAWRVKLPSILFLLFFAVDWIGAQVGHSTAWRTAAWLTRRRRALSNRPSAVCSPRRDTRNVSKKRGESTSHPGSSSRALARCKLSAWIRLAMFLKPSGPW